MYFSANKVGVSDPSPLDKKVARQIIHGGKEDNWIYPFDENAAAVLLTNPLNVEMQVKEWYREAFAQRDKWANSCRNELLLKFDVPTSHNFIESELGKHLPEETHWLLNKYITMLNKMGADNLSLETAESSAYTFDGRFSDEAKTAETEYQIGRYNENQSKNQSLKFFSITREDGAELITNTEWGRELLKNRVSINSSKKANGMSRNIVIANGSDKVVIDLIEGVIHGEGEFGALNSSGLWSIANANLDAAISTTEDFIKDFN